MKAIPSVLFSQLRGKAGTVVASGWKGIPYVRRHLIPANPNSAGQQTQRALFAKVVSWWHDLESQVQDECEALVEGLSMSGYNAFVKRNLKDLADAVDPRIMPLNATVNPINTFAGAAGGGAKTIDVTWVQGEADALDTVYIIAAEDDGGDPGDNLAVIEKDTNTTDVLGSTLTMGKASTLYHLWCLVEDGSDHFSVADYTTATSNA